MHRARAGWRCGVYPAHHLFGTAYLDRPFDVVDIRYRNDDLLAHATRYLQGRVGDLGLQLRAAARIRRRSVIYTAQAQALAGLALLRRSGLIPVPVVGVFHGVRSAGPLSHAPLAGFDRAIALSRTTRTALIDGGMSPDRISLLSWGPDLEFPGFAPASPPSSDAPMVATGKTGRDLKTLIAALRRTGDAARIYGDRESLAKEGPIPNRVQVVPSVPPEPPSDAPYTYAHTVQDLRSAAVIAIPLSDLHPLHGLTELADAIACARPVIATRAPYFDLDIESIGCGWWVQQGDIDGWAAAITEALSDRARLAEMGQAGHRWAAEHWNARLFAVDVQQVLLDVARQTTP